MRGVRGVDCSRFRVPHDHDIAGAMNAHLQENAPYIHRRIDRALRHVLAAKSAQWAHRWGDCFVTYVRARNALRTPGEVRQLERERGLR